MTAGGTDDRCCTGDWVQPDTQTGKHMYTLVVRLGVVAVVALLLAACGPTAETGQAPAGETAADDPTPTVVPTEPAPTARDDAVSGTIQLYASVTQDTVDAVLEAYQAAHPDVTVELFRAPTGELNARIAAEQREGDIQADVLWLTDPLSMQQYAAQDLLRRWTPAQADAVPPEYQEKTFWGTRLLNMVIVYQEGLEPAPTAWTDLASAAYEQPVAIPDPGFAGSAFAALGYFALSEEFGFDYYRDLADAGAVQVQAPGEVVTGVAEGRFAAGMTLHRAARDAIADGSPIAVVRPEPGAIAIYSPIAVVSSTSNAEAAESFANFTLTEEGQEAIADTGWQPVRGDVEWEHGGDSVTPDWDALFDRQDELLEQYREIFGG